jgi:hypothetical protein
MRCNDGQYYVVKFQNNPQGVRILANEMLAGQLGVMLGLPVPQPEVVEVDEWLVEHSPEMYLQVGSERVRCAGGLQFGSRFPCDPLHTPVYDFLPDSLLESLANRRHLPGMLAFDQWTCNCDARQLVFHRTAADPVEYAASMVDQGFCFNAGEWNFPDAPGRGLYCRLAVYQEVSGWEAFEPFLSRVESLADELLEEAAARVPPEWYEGEADAFCALVSGLGERRGRVRELLSACAQSEKRPFPNWKGGMP